MNLQYKFKEIITLRFIKVGFTYFVRIVPYNKQQQLSPLAAEVP